MNDQPFPELALEILLARACDGDREARNELFGHVFKRLVRLAQPRLAAFPVVGCREEVGDVLDAAVCRLLPALDKLKPTSMPAFFALARAEIEWALLVHARYYGKESQRHMHEEPSPSRGSLPLEAELCDPNDDPSDLEDWAAMQAAIECLPIAEREVASLRLHHGWTEARIAELFRVSERTVRNRWQSAVAKLNRVLTGGGVGVAQSRP